MHFALPVCLLSLSSPPSRHAFVSDSASSANYISWHRPIVGRTSPQLAPGRCKNKRLAALPAPELTLFCFFIANPLSISLDSGERSRRVRRKRMLLLALISWFLYVVYLEQTWGFRSRVGSHRVRPELFGTFYVRDLSGRWHLASLVATERKPSLVSKPSRCISGFFESALTTVELVCCACVARALSHTRSLHTICHISITVSGKTYNAWVSRV